MLFSIRIRISCRDTSPAHASVGSQLFRLVLVVKREMLCLTFALLHFGQATLVLP
jgi:hypothetical protein